MSDALLGLTEVTNASNAKIASIVQSYLVQEAMILPKLTDYSYLWKKGDKSVAIPRSGGTTYAQKTENTSIDSQTVTYASDAIVVGEPYAAQFLIEDSANAQAAPEIVSDILLKAGKDAALALDTVAIAAMVAGASASAPDHQVVFASTSDDIIAAADITAARKLLQTQNINPSECYIGIGPEKEAELLGISNFISANIYGAGTPLATGVIGKIYGFNVVVHTGFADRAVYWHPSCTGYVNVGYKVESQRDLANLADRYSLSNFFACKVLDSGKRLVHQDSTN